jgi:hypothetical protein
MVGIEMMRPHDYFGDNSWVVVGVAPSEISGPAVLHNDPTKVKDHGIDGSLAHKLKSYRLLMVPANWLRGVHR